MKYWEIISEQTQRSGLELGLLQRRYAARLALGR